jgi:hypothetical protein
MAAWLGTYFAVHHFIGYKPATFFLSTAIAGNLTYLGYAILFNALMPGFVLLFAIIGLRSSPRLIRVMAVALVPYLAVLAAIGYWVEIRYWMSTLPVMVPAFLASLRDANPLSQPSSVPGVPSAA